MNPLKAVVCCFGSLVFGVVTTIASAQEAGPDAPPANSQQSSTVEMAVVAGDDMATPLIISSTSSNGGPAVMKFGTFASDGGEMFSFSANPSSGPPSSFNLLSDASVQKDLELVGDQLDQINDLQKSFSEKMKAQIGDITKDGMNPERLKGMKELIQKLRDEQESEIGSLLLPHQVERLKQISVQRHFQFAGTAGALASEQLAKELGISDEQKERLQKRSKEVATDLEKQMAQLKADAREEILQELTAQQREKLKKLTGDEFKSNPQDWDEKMKRFKSPRQ